MGGGESLSTDEVGEEHDPLLGFRSRNGLPCVRSQCAMSAAKYPASRSFVMSSSVTEEAIHLPPAPDMFGMVVRRR